MNKLKVMSVFGTRPEAIKMAPLVKALQASEQIESIVCLTGQHREMLDSVMEIFQLTGDYDLHIMEKRQTLSTITTKTLLGMDSVLDTVKPDLVLVHGDTSTTFTGALAAFYHQVKVGHVEAGLRTWDKYSPFPEEMNRTLVGDIADLHFSPTKANADNLRREAIMGDIFITGNTAIDAMRFRLPDGASERAGFPEPPDHRRHLPPAGELRQAHGGHHARHSGDRADAPRCGGRLSRPPESRCARMRFPDSGRPRPHSPHRSGRRGGNAQSHCPLLYGHD